MPFAATQMGLEISILNEIRSQTVKNKYIMYMWNLKSNTNELICKTETDLQTQEINLWSPKGKGQRDKLGV